MNAAGFLGFSPEPRRMLCLERFGAFVTNPISLYPRTPAKNREFNPFENGYIMHSGLPNQGLEKTIHLHAKHWAISTLPVIIHFMIQEMTDIPIFISRIEGLVGLGAIEFSFSPDIQTSQIRTGLSRLASELPVILNLDPDKAFSIMENSHQYPISAISISNPRGVLPKTAGEFVQGRYYSRSLLPQTISEVIRLTKLGIPVYAGAGVTTDEDIELVLKAGASAVQLNSILWD